MYIMTDKSSSSTWRAQRDVRTCMYVCMYVQLLFIILPEQPCELRVRVSRITWMWNVTREYQSCFHVQRETRNSSCSRAWFSCGCIVNTSSRRFGMTGQYLFVDYSSLNVRRRFRLLVLVMIVSRWVHLHDIHVRSLQAKRFSTSFVMMIVVGGRPYVRDVCIAMYIRVCIYRDSMYNGNDNI